MLDFELIFFYKFKVKVFDDGVLSFVVFIDVEVFVEDVNDFLFVFVFLVFYVILYLLIFLGIEIIRVSVIDGDILFFVNLIYFIVR